MRPIILGKNLLSDEEVLAFAMSEENFRLLTLECLHQQATRAALLTASTLIRLHSGSRPPAIARDPEGPAEGNS